MPDHVISVRNVIDDDGNFGNEPGDIHYLRLPANRLPKASHAINRKVWLDHVMAEAKTGTDVNTGLPIGDILVYVHGYNVGTDDMIKRHRQLQANLETAGYEGAVVSFDWPSAQQAINYLEDRTDAKMTAIKLVTGGILPLAMAQSEECLINVHLLGHSMGAYVIREAFDDADDRPRVAAISWTVSQVCLIGADISSKSMRSGSDKTSSLYRHSTRITNYYNPYDAVLQVSNVKRVGVAPRLGRIGLPAETPSKAVDVDCGPYFMDKYGDRADRGIYAHTWYIEDDFFIKDLLFTLQGDIDRNRIPTRRRDGESRLSLLVGQ